MGLFASLTDKSWATHGPLEELPSGELQFASVHRTGLRTFLFVAGALFGLFAAAYFVRADYADWVPVEDPNLLWLNTALLILASVGLQFARNAATVGDRSRMQLGLLLGGLLTLAFLAGQYWAWQQLIATGAYTVTDASYAFFFLLTGIHGLHLAGGLYVWLRVMFRLSRTAEGEDVTQANKLRLSIELCSVYWHFLLLIWLVLFALLLNT